MRRSGFRVQRVRLCWSDKRERPWCPGASRPQGDSLPAATWTSFFRLNVDRWRDRTAGAGDDMERIPAALPTSAVGEAEAE